jgi:hypothetical protein
MYRGSGQIPVPPMTQDERRSFTYLSLKRMQKGTFALTMDIPVYAWWMSNEAWSANAIATPAYRWPHLRKSGAPINVAYSDGHAETFDMGTAEYRRTTWNSRVGSAWTWASEADPMACLYFIGFDRNKDFSRLKAWYPFLPP